MQLHVDDLDSLYEQAILLTKKYKHIKINKILNLVKHLFEISQPFFEKYF